jgi:ABC-type proline/glycine betaine transport system permease subunit
VSGTGVSVVAVAVLMAVGVVLGISASRRHHLASLGQTLTAAMRTTPGRATVLLTWAWLGVHFLAR